MLKDVIPRISQVAILVKPDNPFFGTALRALEIPAKSLNVRLHQFEVRGPNDFADAFVAIAKSGVDAAVILEDAVFVSNARAIAELATKQRLPSAGFDEFAEAGGLDRLWGRFSRNVSPRRGFCGQDSQGCQAC
jgi:ABC-type uncharacterized transport system substrate-binding protein